MYKLKNLTNSPYSITLADGTKTMLPARGTLGAVDIHEQHVRMIRACGFIEISKCPIPSDISVPTGKTLEEKYEELTGEHPDKRWGRKRLLDEIKARGKEDD